MSPARSLRLVERDWAAESLPVRPLRVALVNMPWARADAPSIQCGLLKSGLVRYGHRVDVLDANLELSREVGGDRYACISGMPETRQILLGDWLFGGAVYAGTAYEHDDRYLARHSEALGPLAEVGLHPADLQGLRDETLPRWLNQYHAKVDWSVYDLVGFTSTFAQNLAAVALADRLKRAMPRVVTLFGGANLEGGMGVELMRAFPPIDYSVSGEGDLILPVIAARLSAGRSPLGLPGVNGRDPDGAIVVGGTAPKVDDLDALPEPDYTDYFATLDALGRRETLGGGRLRMLLETSRGCWWGEKHHCTFCGLNQLSMAYRAKSAPRVVGELRRLAARHGILDIDAVDSIMDMRYLSTMCRDLADQHWDLRLFYEVKANLSREQLRSLKHAGIRRIQPGVESLSTHVLTLMRKGSTLLTNVRLLKWARYYDLQVDWNLLFGFPGETDADYEAQLDLLPSLTHLAPPAGVGQLWLERFSPYFTEDHGFTDIRPLDVYGEVYPVPGVDLAELAYFFDYKVDGICSALVRDTLAAAVEQWRRRWIEGRVPLLRYERGPDWLSIVDTRGAEPRQVTLRDWYADAYLACDDKPRTPAAIRAALGERVQEEELAAFLATCMTNRLMVGEDGRYLSLALPKNPNW